MNSQGRRLALLRSALGFSGYGGQSRFARRLGTKPQRINNVEQGLAGISRRLAEQIVQEFPGVTGGWLHYGETAGLSPQILEKLLAAATQQGEDDSDVVSGRRR